MSQPKPFHRNYRGFIDCENAVYSQWAYIMDREYAQSPEHYVRAFLLIQKDLQRLFEFVEPSDGNLETHSFRIHELLMRTCIEVEANFKAILKENTFNPPGRSEKRWNIHDYWKVNKTHRLSSYKIHVPIWDGAQSTFTPFQRWATAADLDWYQAYNRSKHDRHHEFKEANLRHLLNAVSGLLVVLSSQFRTEEFSPGNSNLVVGGEYNYYDTEPALGGFFHIDFPDDWTEDEKYGFDWRELKKEPDRFEKIDFDAL